MNLLLLKSCFLGGYVIASGTVEKRREKKESFSDGSLLSVYPTLRTKRQKCTMKYIFSLGFAQFTVASLH